MKALRLLTVAAATVVSASCSDGSGVVGPTTPEVSLNRLPSAPARSPASGEFDAVVDFSTLTLTPKGRTCLLQVDGQLILTGTLEGVATGTTTALVFATCADVAVNPPGTFRDIFRSSLEFEGTVNGEPVEGSMVYAGSVQPGGNIDAVILLSAGRVNAVLETDAVVAVGGSYSGFVSTGRQ